MKTITIEQILESVNVSFKVSLGENTVSQKGDIIEALKVYCYLARKHTDLSFAKIGAAVNKGYCDILYHNKTAIGFLENNTDFIRKVNKAELNLMRLDFPFRKKRLEGEMKEFIKIFDLQDPFVVGLKNALKAAKNL